MAKVVAEGASMAEEISSTGWLKHYSSCHQILLVGEGDFSFSLCLAQSFGSASNIVATSLDSYDSVIGKYKKAKLNLEKLEKLGAVLLHKVDATKMKLHTDLKMRKFDRIIFNFPHAGFHGKEDQVRVIRMHKKLMKGFFRNASGMLRPCGEIHVNHKTAGPFCNWNLEELASRHSLELIECAEFKIADYPGYKNKRGDGPRCDKSFPLGKCSTFKFVVARNRRTKTLGVIRKGSNGGLPQIQEMPLQNRVQVNSPHGERSYTPYMGSQRPCDIQTKSQSNYCTIDSWFNTPWAVGSHGGRSPRGERIQTLPNLHHALQSHLIHSWSDNSWRVGSYVGMSPHVERIQTLQNPHHALQSHSIDSWADIPCRLGSYVGKSAHGDRIQTLQNPHHALQSHPVDLWSNTPWKVGFHVDRSPRGERIQTLQNPHHVLQSHPAGCPRTDFIFNMQEIPGYSGAPVIMQNEFERISDGYLIEANARLGRTDYDYPQVGQQKIEEGFGRYKSGAPGRTVNGFIPYLEALHHSSNRRSDWMQRFP
ncbi:uncharacterized protein LOC122059311 [Macadamia integrifolia]|uniref:uncharacterized protein LOC122059311 n=1 Tax=Macadamia integrifolia TaxID=60698 RepID=UPI001C52951A|nr:uncharacterized protein LOC122059311 [Macadamia integrifolia]